MHGYPTAYTDDNLAEIIDANDSVPPWFSGDVVQRAVDHAKQRAQARGEETALDDTEEECLIVTDWNSFTDDWGFDDGTSNQAALGVLNEDISASKDATLFSNVDILQSGWLRSGDGRKTHAERYEPDWDEGSTGEMWIPKGAQEYICIVRLSDELIHGEIQLEDAL